MNERIEKLIKQATTIRYSGPGEIEEFDKELFAELLVKMCADAADMAYDARCKYVGDYVAEAMGYGEEEGITAWRMAE
jgi:hypothetical protein